jgi:hypothetical protein
MEASTPPWVLAYLWKGGLCTLLADPHFATTRYQAFNIKVAPHFLMELHASLAAAVPNAIYVEHIPQLRAITTKETGSSTGTPYRHRSRASVSLGTAGRWSRCA